MISFSQFKSVVNHLELKTTTGKSYSIPKLDLLFQHFQSFQFSKIESFLSTNISGNNINL